MDVPDRSKDKDGPLEAKSAGGFFILGVNDDARQNLFPMMALAIGLFWAFEAHLV